VRSARFLFPFEARRRFFYCTSFGLARALHYLQQVHASEHGPASAADREAAGNLRIGRVQRQKVRISRRRLLDSAAKVFELYAGAKAQLEIEFFNEVGTGLGPTLEFYTLLSHELQRRSLGIWRHTAAPSGAANDGTKPAAVEAAAPAAAAAAAAAAGGGGRGQTAAARRQSGPGPLAGELGEEAGQHESVRASELVVAPQGLFPAPLPPGQRGDDSKAAAHFRLLGRAVAKALQDNRLLDLPLSPLFYRLALQRRVDLYDIRRLDSSLGASLERLHAAFHAHAAAGGAGPLLVDGVPLEELCLTWELPGYPSYPLHPDHGPDVRTRAGRQLAWELQSAANLACSEHVPTFACPVVCLLVTSNRLLLTTARCPLPLPLQQSPVTAANLRQYLDAVVEATLGAGVSAQVSAFRQGFSAIFPLDALTAFYEDEIEAMLCGTGEAWSVDYLAEVIKFDHGYTAQSPAVRFLLEVLSELDAVEQRRFLRFVTGTPRLPPGGLAALQPRLTVVRKLSHAAMAAIEGTSAPVAQSLGVSVGGTSAGSVPGGPRHPADGDLPSVMTCANYIKLPPYSSREVLRERLLFAITEGQNSFDLS
jgi:E3 ubiquitin-protein ligase TRIP12